MKSLLPFALLALTLASCDFFVYGSERAGCEGHPEFLRTLPDTTITLSGGPLIIPLDDPPLAHHTGGKNPQYWAESDNQDVALSTITRVDGKDVIIVWPINTGKAVIYTLATDDCEGKDVITFKVTVIT